MDESMLNEIRRTMQLAKQQIQEHNAEFGMSLMEAGFRIVPSPYIEDNFIIVSQNVYDAIKAAIEAGDVK